MICFLLNSWVHWEARFCHRFSQEIRSQTRRQNKFIFPFLWDIIPPLPSTRMVFFSIRLLSGSLSLFVPNFAPQMQFLLLSRFSSEILKLHCFGVGGPEVGMMVGLSKTLAQCNPTQKSLFIWNCVVTFHANWRQTPRTHQIFKQANTASRIHMVQLHECFTEDEQVHLGRIENFSHHTQKDAPNVKILCSD